MLLDWTLSNRRLLYEKLVGDGRVRTQEVRIKLLPEERFDHLWSQFGPALETESKQGQKF